MQNEIRHFIPGDCATGPNKRTFTELDRGIQNAQLLTLGQEACRSCLQLPDCKRQREPIAEELENRGVTGKTVVAAEVIEIPASEVDKSTPRRDPEFTFNLEYPLTEPRHILEIIRQGFRSRQLSIKATQTNQYKVLSAHLEERLRNENHELPETKVRSWARKVAQLVLKYQQIAHGSDWSADRELTALFKGGIRAAATMREAEAIQAVFVEDALALQAAGFEKPEALAQVHNPEFYNRLAQAYDSDPDASIGLMHQVLCDIDPLPQRKYKHKDKNDTDAAKKRRREQLRERFTPEFKSRSIGITYLKLKLSEAEVHNRLALYDEVVKTFPVMKAMRTAIHHFCFLTDTPDPIAEIRAWKRAVAEMDPSYIQLLGRPYVSEVALRKRNEDLEEELNSRVKLLNELSAEYAQSPHPAVDDEVIKHALQAPSTARKQLKGQEKRWETVHTVPEIAEIIAETNTKVLRRILMLHRKDPIEAIKAYQQLKDRYRYDDYVELPRIDDAIKWGVGQAATSIRRLKTLLKKTDGVKVSLDRPLHAAKEEGLSQHEKMASLTTPDVDAQITSLHIDPTAPTREETQLLNLVSSLRPEERAAVALVYRIPWLLPESMRDDGWDEEDKVCKALDADDIDELESLVEIIISKLHDN